MKQTLVARSLLPEQQQYQESCVLYGLGEHLTFVYEDPELLYIGCVTIILHGRTVPEYYSSAST
jgi:hypothetical protein